MNHLYINGVEDRAEARIMLHGDRLREMTRGDYWVPNTATQLWQGRSRRKRGARQTVREVIQVAALGDASEIIRVENKIWRAAHRSWEWHHNSTWDDSLWLYWRVDGEPVAKRALIHSLEWTPNSETDSYLKHGARIGELIIERYVWENVTPLVGNLSSVSLAGGASDLGNVGTRDARIALLRLKALGGSGGLNEVWVGIRRGLDGIDDFEAVWEVEKGRIDPKTPDSYFEYDGTAYDQKLVIPFTDEETLTRRLRIKVGEVLKVGGDPRHFVGRYLVLGRVKASDTDSRLFLQMRYGNSANENKVEHQYVFMASHDQWHLQPLGEVQLPAGANRVNAVNDIRHSEIEIWAGRREGLAKLEIDRLILIPSRHMVKIEAPEILSGLETLIEFRTHENDSYSTEITMGLDGPVYSAIPRNRKLFLPYDGGLMVVAGQRNRVSVPNDYVEFEMQWHPRWVSYVERDRYQC